METVESFFSSLPKNIDKKKLKSFAPDEMWDQNPEEAMILALRKSGFFDAEDYVNRYLDVKNHKLDPIDHYVRYGIKEGRFFYATCPIDPNKEKILFISHEMSYTGAPRSLLRLCLMAKRLGYEPIVWTASDGEYRQEFIKNNISVQVVKAMFLNEKLYINIIKSCVFALCNTIITDKYVHFINRIIPCIWFIRESNISYFCQDNPDCLDLIKTYNNLFCVSEYAAECIEKFTQNTVNVMHNCIEDMTKYASRYIPSTSERIRFLLLGSIEYNKGYDIILLAYKFMPEEYKKKCELYFFGGCVGTFAEYANTLFSQISTIPSIHYLGLIRDERKKIETISQMDVVVVPSRHESCSLVALEGAMLSKPLIVTENVGAKYMVSEENGIIIPSDSPQELAKAMMKLIDQKEKLADMGKKSRLLYEKYASMQIYESALKKIIATYKYHLNDMLKIPFHDFKEKEKSPVFRCSQPKTMLSASQDQIIPANLRQLVSKDAKDKTTALILALRRSGDFDAEDYLKRYPDVRQDGVDPIEHYVRYGIKEKRFFSKKLKKNSLGEKKILFVSHEMTYTGAPSSLLRLCIVAHKFGYTPIIWSAQDGDYKEEFLKNGFSVTIVPELEILKYVDIIKSCAFSLCNTIVTDTYVRTIKKYIPCLWFIHEANIDPYCRNNKERLDLIKKHEDIFCVSEYASGCVRKYREKSVNIMHNCIDDISKYAINYIIGTSKKVRFVQFGTLNNRKGYDILISAYRSMPEDYQHKCEFYFAGRVMDGDIKYCNTIFSETNAIPAFHYLGVITDDEYKIQILSQMDVVVIASRSESCSLVALEGAMLSKPLIVTENVGAKYMVNHENGLIVPSDNVPEMTKALMALINAREKLPEMGKKSRLFYEKYASMTSYYSVCRKLFEIYENHKNDMPPFIDFQENTIQNINETSNLAKQKALSENLLKILPQNLVSQDIQESEDALILTLRRSGTFNAEEYLKKYPDVRKNGMDPIDHYIRYGRKEKRTLFLKKHDIDIVIPVFNALEDVKRCLFSVKNNTCGLDVHIILVNDFSNEETSLWLRNVCKNNPLFTLIENPSNQGYTKSVNIGMKASDAPYVLLLNSDAIVTSGWLTKMMQCMASNPQMGIVGPLSNSAGWQNVPILYGEDGDIALNVLPQGISIEKMARLVEDTSLRLYPPLQFVNGFCFMIRREVIDAIGFMDEVNFPIGYGEEDDYCMRAFDAGFVFAIADDTFVFHAKSKSFGNTRRLALCEQASKTLRQKHTPQKREALFQRDKQINKKTLDIVRTRIQKALNEQQVMRIPESKDMRLLFIFPENTLAKNAESVLREISTMIKLGINIGIGVEYSRKKEFDSAYGNIPDIEKVSFSYNNVSLPDLAKNYDAVIGVGCSSFNLIRFLSTSFKHMLIGYYTQNHEKNIDEDPYEWQEEKESHTLAKDILLLDGTKATENIPVGYKKQHLTKVMNDIDNIEKHLGKWRSAHCRPHNVLLTMPNTEGNRISYFSTSYVRVLLPYQFIAEHNNIEIRPIQTLPNPGSADAMLLQRELRQSKEELETWISSWKLGGGKLIYEIDDNLLDLDALIARGCGKKSDDYTGKIELLASAADAIHVSTPRLYEIFSKLNPNVHIVPNALDKDIWLLDRQRLHNYGQFKRNENIVRIGYIGTPTHDADLALIRDAMHQLESKYKNNIEIEVIGGFHRKDVLFGKKIDLPQRNEYPDFVRWLYNRVHWDIGIIPLVNDEFNKSKSYLKFLEYSALDMAIAVSDVPTYREVARNERNCLTVQASTEDWVEKVSMLIEDKKLRQTLATNARKECLANHTLASQARCIEKSLQKLGLLN